MRRAVRLCAIALVTVFAFGSATTATAVVAEEDFKSAPISIATITAGELASRIEPVPDDSLIFTPLFSNTSARGPLNLSIEGMATALIRPADLQAFLGAYTSEYEIQNRPEVLSGPQGTLYGKPVVTIGSPGNSDFYEGHTAVTALLTKIKWEDPLFSMRDLFLYGELDASASPEEVDDVVEASFDFTYFGDEVLEVSPSFDWDPLIGYGNVANWGIFDGQEFATYTKYIQGWQQYQEQLIRFWFYGQDEDQTGYLYIGWVAPSIPDGMGVTLSYSDTPTLEDMFAQHVAITQVDTELTFDFELGDDFSDGGLTYGDIDQSYRDTALAFTNQFAQSVATEDPPPASSSTTSSTTSSGTTGMTLDSTAISPTDDPDITQLVGWWNFQRVLLFLLVPIALILLVVMLVRLSRRLSERHLWAVEQGHLDGTEDDLDRMAGRPDDYDGMAGSGYDENRKETGGRDTSPTSAYKEAGFSSFEEAVLARHLRDFGGKDPVDGWIAPAYGAIELWVGESEDRPGDAWSETFFNVDTTDLVRRGDDGFDELMEKLNVPTPPEWEDPVGTDNDIPTN